MNWDSFDQYGGHPDGSRPTASRKDVQEALYEANEISSSQSLSNKKYIMNRQHHLSSPLAPHFGVFKLEFITYKSNSVTTKDLLAVQKRRKWLKLTFANLSSKFTLRKGLQSPTFVCQSIGGVIFELRKVYLTKCSKRENFIIKLYAI